MPAAKKTAYSVDGDTKEIVRLIQQMGYKHSTWTVFEDFLQMAAISISNTVDWTHSEEREAQYMEIVGRYSKEEINNFPQMLAHLVTALEEGEDDILGRVFHALELHNKYNGQFFTPMNVCDMMGKIAIGEHDKIIEEKGYVTVCEPCCGSGAMLIGFAKALKDSGYNYQQHMVVTATDIDLKCVHMCYLQLSLLHIPAVVIHGNSLTLEEWSRWYTPTYLLNGWIWRQSCGNLDKQYPEDEALKRSMEPMYAAIKNIEALRPDIAETTQAKCEVLKEEMPQQNTTFQETEHGQLTLFLKK